MLYIVNTGKNDSSVGFRFEDLPAFSIEENAAFDVAEVAITGCQAVAALGSCTLSELVSAHEGLNLLGCSVSTSLVGENVLPDRELSLIHISEPTRPY